MKNKFLNLKNEWLSFPLEKRIKRYLLFLGLFFIFIMFDQLTKTQIFNDEQYSKAFFKPIDYNYKIIGFRPILHPGVTSGLHIKIGFLGIHILSFSFSIVILFFVFWTKKITYMVILAISLAGILGNTIDRFLYADNSVKDFIFLPWYDRGTFNLADVFILSSIILFFILIILESINEWIKKRKNKKEQM
ncbi:signal peptidase II [[Mycoplasma] collis]|uniref:signal peptidase II n=1 Tax=[Mycoplasma] collis TaxID=2127 RepID=UPI000689EDA7|nr:signal peptidase II [[Mycoplasma] collis]